jgi:hypothetical protein
MNRQHSSQQKFFDLLDELEFRAIFLSTMGVMYHGHFPFLNGRDMPGPFFFPQWALCTMAIFLSSMGVMYHGHFSFLNGRDVPLRIC